MSDLSRCKWNNGHASGKEYLEEQQDKETNKILEMLKTEKQQKEIDSLKAENKKLREGLEFYGDRKNWGAFDFIPDDGEWFYQGNDGHKDVFIIQAGEKARQILSEIDTDNKNLNEFED